MDHILNLITRYPALECIHHQVTRAVGILENCYRKNGKLLVCGNGGSAADADHIAGELNKGFVKKRALDMSARKRFDFAPEPARTALLERLQRGLPAIPLTGMNAALSAVINDNGAEFMYAQMVHALCKEGDVFLGISTSGSAKNVVYACITAKAFGLSTIALSGGGTGKDAGGALAQICDVSICVPETETYKIQEYHVPVYHAICLELEERFFNDAV
jgi:D-sedoheptulose 7-phosphate isomerase